jgi:hypothetical protein
MSGLNICGVLDHTAWQLGKCIAEGSNTLCLHFEPALLRHRSIPTDNEDDQSKR